MARSLLAVAGGSACDELSHGGGIIALRGGSLRPDVLTPGAEMCLAHSKAPMRGTRALPGRRRLPFGSILGASCKVRSVLLTLAVALSHLDWAA
jgi:hypothetical protein